MFLDRLDEFQEILEELYNELPEGILNTLNGGIIIEEDVMYHPDAQNDDIVCLGAYRRDLIGNSIIMCYGSFMLMYWDLPHDEFKEKIKETLYHEITHHLEFESGNNDLVVDDEKQLIKIKKLRSRHE